MTHSLIKTALGAMALLSTVACTTNYYDEEKYEEYIKYNSPVDSVDQYHQWRLTEERSYKITANVSLDVEKVMLLTANPLSSTKAEIMNEGVIAKGESKQMMVSVPMTQTTLYAALVDTNGEYYVKSFPVTQMEVDFSGGINTGTPIGTLKPQTYSYIYEKDFPLVGDYDYNDLVYRISVEHTTPKQVVVHVTLSAVGCNEQLAGYFRVMGCKFDDIDSVTTANGKTFNDNLPAGSKNFVRSYDLLICSTKNQPVITVCADAHWAMDPYQSIMENLLMTTKGVCDLYMHGTIESSTQNVHQAFDKALNDTLCMQEEIYGKMAGKGWYPTAQADQQQIDQVRQKYAGQN